MENYRKVKDIEKQFENLKENGHFLKYTNLNYYSHYANEHVQGCTRTIIDGIEYTVFSHNIDSGKRNNHGYLFRKSGAKTKDTLKVPTPDGWKHPGGIQAIGKYLFVACERGSTSKLFVYDLSISNDMPIVYEKEFSCHSASSVGITEVS